MLNHLNVNTRRVVLSLCKGGVAQLGQNIISSIDSSSRLLLAVISINKDLLPEYKGQDLVDKTLKLLSKFEMQDVLEDSQSFDKSQEYRLIKKFKLANVTACSFRGLAPAGREWEYGFDEKSHLIHGPNGSGKSSLLGAVCWCLTGKIFRDDCPPSEPEKITAFSVTAVGKIERDDAHSLIDMNGNSSSTDNSYWVKVLLTGSDSLGNTGEIHLLRDSHKGLSFSNDDQTWIPISSLLDAGIDDLDAELRLLMPAQVAHMTLGKNPDIIRLLSQVIGYGDLETITEIADKLASSAKRAATTVAKKELLPLENIVNESVAKIKKNAVSAVEELPSYKLILSNSRIKKDVEDFGKDINQKIEDVKVQLASDLSLDIPDKDSDDYKKWQEKSNNLPGQITNLLSDLDNPLTDLFDNSIGLAIPSAEELESLDEKLKGFEAEALNGIKERLDFAKKEAENVKLELMLKAGSFFSEDSKACPVCDQSLDKVPEIKKELDELRTLGKKEHLQKKIKDYELSLKASLDSIVNAKDRSTGGKSLSDWIQHDWDEFKKNHCKDLLLIIANRYDKDVSNTLKGINQKDLDLFKLPAEYDEYSSSFDSFGQELDKAKSYAELCKCIQSTKEQLSESLKNIIIEGEDNSSLKQVLERAKENNDTLKKLLFIKQHAGVIWTSTQKIVELKKKIQSYLDLSDAAAPIKALKDKVREEVTRMVTGELGQKTQAYYEKLYDNEVLPFQQLTTGHAANPNIKTEINLYLKAGNHQVPMGPYSNAGRMRALLLAFVFALLEKSSDSLNFVILDDPALSLDDEHKARFVDHLVDPLINKGQVILGTHYERFYVDSEPAFINSIKLRMIPRQRVSDEVVFEAGDLLDRVQEALDSNTGQWREVAGNIRIWIERTLATLSGYSPKPFVIFNNIPDTIENYSNLRDPIFITSDYTTILTVLKQNQITRILHKLHHDEPVNKPDAQDAFNTLQGCKKAVKNEIERFKGLFNHALYNRKKGSDESSTLDILQFRKGKINKKIQVVREAAAAHNGEGIEWDCTDEYSLENNIVVHVCTDSIAPIALIGQYLILDSIDNFPGNGDIIVAETHDNQKYVRRIWVDDDGGIVLEAANPTIPCEPIRTASGKCKVRRVVGVLYDEATPTACSEWAMRQLDANYLKSIMGIKVKGTSLEPIARNGQIVLTGTNDIKNELENNMLVCLSIEGIGDVIKRCYVSESKCILCAVNPNELELPIVVGLETIQKAYLLKGVIFEPGIGISII